MIFLLQRRSRPSRDYDTNHAMVVRADTYERARQVAAAKACDEGPDTWLREQSSTCEELFAGGPEGAIVIAGLNG